MLVLAKNTQAYFREALEAALKKSQICVTDSAQVYVVHLMSEFCRAENVYAGTDYGEKLVMVEMLERAIAAEHNESLQIFRHLGDTALYLLGYFKESEKRRITSPSYYRDMGANAYLQASNLSRVHAAQSAALYMELSEKFTEIANLLAIMAEYSKDLSSN